MGVSQDAHAVNDGLFINIHASHFQDPSSALPNVAPHPSVLPPLSALGAASSSELSSSPLSSSLSPSPNSQSMYHSTKAFFVITLSPDDSSCELIFFIARPWSSSQYVEPRDSMRLLKFEANIVGEPSDSSSNAVPAFSFSSATSLS